MAKARGAVLTAIPVFPRRLYSQSQMYVNTGAGIKEPRDLIGKRVGLRSFQTTLSVLAKGDLQRDYGVPLDQVNWVTSADEPVPFTPPPGVRIERAPRDPSIETMLVEGAIHYYDDPNWSHLAWAVHILREERQAMGLAAWANGLSRNRKNLERFIQYVLEQGLIDRRLEVEALFHETTHHT